MKKARRTLMALGVVVFSLSAALTAKIKEKSVLAQLNCSKAKPITSSWGDDKHIFSSFDRLVVNGLSDLIDQSSF